MGAIAPYAEATARIARLGPIRNAATAIALGFLGRPTPMASVGGALVQGGPIVFDIGYRFKQLFANDIIEAVLAADSGCGRIRYGRGVGVRF